jgi:predicted ATPase/class 3 adenylate cyclase/Tfp pilus assembly protein PilF
MDPPASLPQGTVTLLFTDIEGSTHLLHRLEERYTELLTDHGRLLRAAFREWGGHEVRTEGDSFFVLFDSAVDAVTAVAAAQRALASHPWPEGASVRVRMGLHTGEPVLTSEGYVGMDIHRAARICAAGHGGQTLLSATTRTLVADELPAGSRLRDLGSHRLKDLPHPERLFQLILDGLPSEFPPLRSLGARPNNLPLQLTRFFGREREIDAVRQHLVGSRLVTLAGPGGTGKTRLALQVASELMPDLPDGAWQAELAPLSDPALLPQAVATAVGVREEAGRSVVQTLCEALRPRRMLLILDTCEHLLDSCASLALALLQACPQVRILATTRESLAIPGEVIVRVPSLSVPDPRAPIESLLSCEAVQLFADRAQLAHPGFAVDEGKVEAVVQICRRLDGIPLAIELAAARVKLLSVGQIAARLDDRFRLLSGGSRSVLRRHQTLRATLDWSYDLLSEPERALLRHLSVFVGGWTLEAAEAICANTDDRCQMSDVSGKEPPSSLSSDICQLSSADILDLLGLLVDKSLVLVEEAPAPRYRMLETIRQYAQEKLVEAEPAGGAAALHDRHRDWYLDLAERAAPELLGASQRAWLAQLDREYDNLRAGLTWCLEPGDRRPPIDGESARVGSTQTGLRLAAALWRYWEARGFLTEGREWLAQFLTADAKSVSPARAKALGGAGFLALQQGDRTAARSLYEESLTIWRQLGDEKGAADALGNLGSVAHAEGQPEAARAFYEESLRLAEGLGHRWGMASSLNNLAILHFDQSEFGEAEACYERALALWEEIGDQIQRAQTLNNLGSIDLARGRLAEAEARFQAAYTIFRQANHPLDMAAALATLGELYLEQGRLGEAKASLEEARTIALPIHARELLTYIHVVLGQTLVTLEEYEAAEACCDAARAQIGPPGSPVNPGWEAQVHRIRGLIHLGRGDAQAALTELETAREILQEADMPQELGRTCLELARVQRQIGEDDAAAALLAAAISLFDRAGAEADLERARALVRTGSCNPPRC